MKIPTKIEHITPQWLTEALSIRYPEVEIQSLKAENFSLPNGTSSFVRVTPTYSSGLAYGLPKTLVIKGGFNRFTSEFDGIYANEMRFYRDVLPLFNLNVPKCFFADLDHQTGKACIIMEDLADRGIKFFSAKTPLSYDEAKGFVGELARWHAITWNHASISPGGAFTSWMCPLLGGGPLAGGSGDAGPWQSSWDLSPIWEWQFGEKYWATDLRLRPQFASMSRIFHDRERLARAAGALERAMRGLPLCIYHGDTHPGNIYLEPEGKYSFYDMQPRAFPCWAEIANHIVVILDYADRRKWEQPLLMHYLTQLSAHGVKPPSFDEAWYLYRIGIIWALCVWVVNDDRHQAPWINTACASRASVAGIDHDSYGLLGI
jgi:hypothetical protein